jgi:hypothetical protein
VSHRPDFVLCIRGTLYESVCGLAIDSSTPVYASIDDWFASIQPHAENLGCPSCVVKVLAMVKLNLFEMQCRLQPGLREEVERYRALYAAGDLELRRGFSFEPKKREAYGFDDGDYVICERDEQLKAWRIMKVEPEDFERVRGIVTGT